MLRIDSALVGISKQLSKVVVLIHTLCTTLFNASLLPSSWAKFYAKDEYEDSSGEGTWHDSWDESLWSD